jgi:hypothetical protein
VLENFETIDERPLAGQDLVPGQRDGEPRRAIYFWKGHGPAAAGRPFDRDLVAANAVGIEIAFKRIAADDFPARWRT